MAPATGKERASAEPVTSTAIFRIIRVFILHPLPWVLEVSIPSTRVSANRGREVTG